VEKDKVNNINEKIDLLQKQVDQIQIQIFKEKKQNGMETHR